MAKQETSYNGWTNWETWVVNLHLTNDYGLYKLVCDFADAYRGKAPAKSWRRFVLGVLNLKTMEREPINSESVNWEELAKNLNSYYEGE